MQREPSAVRWLRNFLTDANVRALTRDPNRASLPGEVELIRGDLTVPETMDASVRDVDAVFLVWTAAADAFPAALRRIAQHTGRVVMLTSPHQTPHPFFKQPNPGRTLRFEEIAPDDARRDLGFPRAAIDMLLDAWSAAAGLPAYVTTTVAEVTGTPARTFAEWVRSNKQAFARP